MREHRRARRPGGSGREQQHRELVVVPLELGGHRRTGLELGCVDRAGPVGQRVRTRAEDDHAGLDPVELRGEHRRRCLRVEGHRDGAGPERRQVRDDEPDVVVAHDPDPVAGRDPRGRERTRTLRGQGLELAVGDRARPLDQRRRVGGTLGPFQQQGDEVHRRDSRRPGTRPQVLHRCRWEGISRSVRFSLNLSRSAADAPCVPFEHVGRARGGHQGRREACARRHDRTPVDVGSAFRALNTRDRRGPGFRYVGTGVVDTEGRPSGGVYGTSLPARPKHVCASCRDPVSKREGGLSRPPSLAFTFTPPQSRSPWDERGCASSLLRHPRSSHWSGVSDQSPGPDETEMAGRVQGPTWKTNWRRAAPRMRTSRTARAIVVPGLTGHLRVAGRP